MRRGRWRSTGSRECYIRPLIYRGYENLGVNPFGSPVEVAVAAFPWGKYLGEDALTKGVAVKVSSWQRFAPNTLPAMAKASANYMNSQLMKMEALVDGYAEAHRARLHGYVSEGSGQNVFAVIKGELVTPPLHSSILAGITRDTVMTLARELGYTVREETMPREMLYAADELFFTGTAVEVSPITSVDRHPGRQRRARADHQALQDAFFAVVRGQSAEHRDWLTLVPKRARAARAAPAAAGAGRARRVAARACGSRSATDHAGFELKERLKRELGRARARGRRPRHALDRAGRLSGLLLPGRRDGGARRRRSAASCSAAAASARRSPPTRCRGSARRW